MHVAESFFNIVWVDIDSLITLLKDRNVILWKDIHFFFIWFFNDGKWEHGLAYHLILPIADYCEGQTYETIFILFTVTSCSLSIVIWDVVQTTYIKSFVLI